MKKGGFFNNCLFLIGAIIAFSLISCGNRNVLGGDSAEYKRLVEKVNSLDFEIQNDWANPLQGNRISLIGNANHITFKNDSVDVFLPFFGYRHAGGGYNHEGAIIYKGPIKELRFEEMPGRGRIKMYFEGDHRTENLDFDITFFPGGKTSTSVNSSQRDRMSYEGRIIEGDQ